MLSSAPNCLPEVAALMDTVISPYSKAVLDHHEFQGRTNDCGPFCVAMIVNAVMAQPVAGTAVTPHPVAGTAVTPHPVAGAAVAQETTRLGSRGLLPVVRRIPGSATFPWGLVDVLADHGLRASWRARGDEAGLRAILASQRLPIVALGGWRPLWGHWVVVLAHSPDLGWGLADPGTPGNDLVWLAEARFQGWWRALGRIVVDVDPVPQRP